MSDLVDRRMASYTVACQFTPNSQPWFVVKTTFEHGRLVQTILPGRYLLLDDAEDIAAKLQHRRDAP